MKHKLLILVLLVSAVWGRASGQTVSGTVRSASDGQPMIGVTVIVRESGTGGITGVEGDFTVRASAGNTLMFSYIGFTPVEIVVGESSLVEVTMQPEVTEIENIVAVGYRTERKADLSGAVSIVKTDEMMSTPDNNPMKALQGRVAGMTVTTDGNPSGSATVRIRGIGTLNSNDPLFVIDGVPSQAGMHELNSNDIESMQVLRDASAASIYGSRAANGVIIITTRRGKKGSVRVDFDTYWSAAMYHTKIDVLNSGDYARAMWQASVNSGIDPNSNNLGIVYADESGAGGYKVLKNVWFPEYLDEGRTMRTANTDWFDAVTRTGFAQSYNLAVSQGTDKGSYYMSLGYYDNEGLVSNTDFSRFSARVNSDFKLWNGIVTIGENFTLNRTSEVQQPYQIIEAALIAVPFIPVRTVDGKGWGGPISGLPDRQNPARLVEDNKDNRYRNWRMFGNAYINIEPVKKLNIRSSFGLDYSNFYKRTLTRSYRSGYLESDRTASNLEQAHWTKWTWSNTVSYDFQFGGSRFETLAGMEMFRQEDINFTAYREGFAFEGADYMWPNEGTGTSEGSGSSTGYALMSFFGKVNYAFRDRYIAAVTLRYDGSSRFAQRWGLFPAANLAWRISEEPFMKPASRVVYDLKLRFGWGQTGNQEISNTAIYDLYGTDYGKGDPTWNSVWGTAYDIEGKGYGMLPSGFKRSQLENRNLRWETTTQTNIGLDFALFGNSLFGSAEYYIKKTSDILYCPGYSAVKGEGANRWYNGASMENRGFEFSIGYRGETTGGFGYEISGNLATNRNKITVLPESVLMEYGGNGKWDNILGRPLSSMYGYVADGIFKTQEQVDTHGRQEGKGVGRIRYRDLNNDSVIDDDDRTWIGNPFPDFTWGLNLTLQWRGFDLMMFIQGVQNVDVVNSVKYTSDFWSVSDTRSNKGARLLDAFHPQFNPSSDIPMLSYTDSNNEARFSTYYVENGSYLKLRNVQIGYNFASGTLKKAGISKLRIYVSGQNLLTLKSRSFTGLDPENPGWGYPIPMTFTGGINFSF